MWYINQASNVGLARKEDTNQDSIGGLLPGSDWKGDPILIVADGMGGHQGGAIASQTVVQTIVRSMQQTLENDPSAALRNSILNSHSKIRDLGLHNPDLQTMGSTVVAVVLRDDRLVLGNVGDSRAYRIRDGQISQISYDHSKVAELVRNGLITPEQAKIHPQRNQLIMSISAQREVIDPYITTVPVQRQDVILLCSDGLWGVVSEEVILGVAQNLPPQQAVERLIELANKNGGPDNISVCIARQEMPKMLAKKEEIEETLPAISASIEKNTASKRKRLPVWVTLVGAGVVVIIGVILGVRLVQNNYPVVKPTENIGNVPAAETRLSEGTQSVIGTISENDSDNNPSITQTPSLQIHTSRVRATDNMTMVLLTNGEVNINGTITQVPGFWLDQSFITTQMYEDCVNAGSCPSVSINSEINPDLPFLPNNITNAQAYCSWVGGRLPSIEEWQRASQIISTIQVNDFPAFSNGFRCVQDASEGTAP